MDRSGTSCGRISAYNGERSLFNFMQRGVEQATTSHRYTLNRPLRVQQVATLCTMLENATVTMILEVDLIDYVYRAAPHRAKGRQQ